MEIAPLNVLFTDETGTLYGHIMDGKFFIHSEPIGPNKVSHIKHYKEIFNQLGVDLKKRGFDQLYTMAADDTGAKYNQLFSFEKTGKYFVVPGSYYEIMVKDI